MSIHMLYIISNAEFLHTKCLKNSNHNKMNGIYYIGLIMPRWRFQMQRNYLRVLLYETIIIKLHL